MTRAQVGFTTVRQFQRFEVLILSRCYCAVHVECASYLVRAHTAMPATALVWTASRRIERRRNERSGDSPTDILTRLPAVVVLERIPVPTLAMARDGIILFANTAFAEMVGYQQDRLSGVGVP